ncbi:MAG TPA: TIGR03435 family protein [Candidatus Sulfopaludibacter sp.]|nr:TIGR03435 family protein [Candidatus Sulfopaludibacter sp.]
MRIVFLGIFACFLALAETDVTGKWAGGQFTLNLKQDGTKLTGTAGPMSSEQYPIQDGVIDGDHLTFHLGTFQFDLHIEGAGIKGQAKMGEQNVPVILERVEALQTGGPLSFEVASVKHSSAEGRGSNMRLDPGRLTCSGVTIKALIRRAYSVQDYQISGPDWLDSERYEITAKFPVKYGVDQIVQMLQNLLAERFKLTIRREKKDMTVYGLVVGKGGLKIHEAEVGNGSTSMNRGKMNAQRINMVHLAEVLSGQVDRPIVDMTGLTGLYSMTLEWAPDANAVSENGPTADIYTAIQQQLGLKLEVRKAPIDMLVEHAEKNPTENL